MESVDRFRRDVVGSALFQSSGYGLFSLFSFIAAKRLNAGVAWVGAIHSSTYWGYLWNFFFSSITASGSPLTNSTTSGLRSCRSSTTVN